ncbi:MAG: hypothetical protein RLZZ306_3602 [Bacteroidota bacterium]|jgi:hypothetical protein
MLVGAWLSWKPHPNSCAKSLIYGNFSPLLVKTLTKAKTSCLSVDIFDNEGIRHTFREWFVAPLSIIENVIEMIISKDIINYYYDEENQKIVLR